MGEEYYVIENDISWEVENADRKAWTTLVSGNECRKLLAV